MKHCLFLCMLALIFAACNTNTATPVPVTTGATGTPTLIFLTNTPAPTGTLTPTPPALPVIISPELAHIDFQDGNNGWGVAVNGTGYILRTVDGGSTWLNATPAGIGSIGLSATLFVLNGNTVWVLDPGTDFYTASLYHTIDGGVTWDSNQVPFGGAYIQFQDSKNGRALADRGAGAGSNAVELYQTSDGGKTWGSVFHNDPTQPGSSDSLPLGGIKNGLYFLNASTGWVTGSLPVAGNIYLYGTHDGGISWTQQSMPLPAGFETNMYMAHAPIFFGQEGFLPLTVYLPNSTGLTFFASHDGGATWSGDPSNANRMIASGRYSFADATHGWSWDGGTILYSSMDGGQTWSRTETSLDLTGKLNQVEFVPTATGSFVGWALTNLVENKASQLYKTTDNGATWTPLIP